MRTIGIDVGIGITGWSIVEKNRVGSNTFKVLGYGAIETDSKVRVEQRLRIIYKDLIKIIEEFEPSVGAVESLFFSTNQKTIINVAQARGVILLALSQFNLEIFDYTPLQVKTSVTGYGRAEKSQVQKMVKILGNLKEIPKPDDVADAIAVAICHLNS